MLSGEEVLKGFELQQENRAAGNMSVPLFYHEARVIILINRANTHSCAKSTDVLARTSTCQARETIFNGSRGRGQ